MKYFGVIAIVALQNVSCQYVKSGISTMRADFISNEAAKTSISLSKSNSLEFLHNDDVMLLGFNATNVIMSGLQVEGDGLNIADGGDILVYGKHPYHMLHHDTMDGFNFWNIEARSTIGEDSFLGGPCQLARGPVGRSYSKLPMHSSIKISGRMHMFDGWNGESIMLRVGSKIIATLSYHWCPAFSTSICTDSGINSGGGPKPDRISAFFEASMPHTSSSLSLVFESTLPRNTDACEISWGLDDVAVSVF